MNLVYATLVNYEETNTRWSIELNPGLAFELFDLVLERPTEEPSYDKLQTIIKENSKLIPPAGSFLPPGETVLGWEADYVFPSPNKTKRNEDETK